MKNEAIMASRFDFINWLIILREILGRSIL